MKKTSLINFIAAVINVIFIFQWIYLAIIAASFTVILFNPKPDLTEKLSGLTVYYSRIDLGAIKTSEDPSRHVVLTNGSGRLHIENSKSVAIYFKILASIIESLVFIYIVFLLKQIFNNLKKGDFFIRNNGLHISKIALSIIGITIFTDVFNFLISRFLSNTMNISNIEFKTYINFHFNTIFLGFLILAIAQIFMKGAELKDEQDLTI